MKPPANN